MPRQQKNTDRQNLDFFLRHSCPWQVSLGAAGLAACSVSQHTLLYRSAIDHLDCHFYSMLLSFLALGLKRTYKVVFDSQYGGEIKGERMLNRIKHSNIWNSEEDNGESNVYKLLHSKVKIFVS